MRKCFCKNLLMIAKENERFELTNSCWIYDKLIDNTDNKGRGHCHITGKYTGAAHYSCNLVFIDCMLFMNSSLDKLVENLNDKNFKYLNEEFSNEQLK